MRGERGEENSLRDAESDQYAGKRQLRPASESSIQEHLEQASHALHLQAVADDYFMRLG